MKNKTVKSDTGNINTVLLIIITAFVCILLGYYLRASLTPQETTKIDKGTSVNSLINPTQQVIPSAKINKKVCSQSRLGISFYIPEYWICEDNDPFLYIHSDSASISISDIGKSATCTGDLIIPKQECVGSTFLSNNNYNFILYTYGEGNKEIFGKLNKKPNLNLSIKYNNMDKSAISEKSLNELLEILNSFEAR